jgi:CheY-like chemotaxis protein
LGFFWMKKLEEAQFDPVFDMRCQECYAPIDYGDSFCRKCGASLEALPASLINVAKALAHRLNNALSIVLTNSQLAMGQIADLPDETSRQLQSRLQDIAAAAVDSGMLIHQFQGFLNSLANGSSQEKSSAYADQLVSDLQIPSAHKEPSFGEDTIKAKAQNLARVGHTSILIVDDEERIRHALSYALTLGGHHVITASDGYEALTLLQSRPYDVAFVDLKMPGMNGWDAADAIKKMDPDIVVILMTGWNVRLDDESLDKGPVDAVITKPFDLSEIYDVIAMAIGSGNA